MYEIYVSETLGKFILKKEEDKITTIVEQPGSPEYEQYLIDTDGGLPIPEGTVE